MLLKSKIKVLRENREWTQAELADKLSVSPDTVQKWEAGKNTPPIDMLKALADVFCVPVDTLVNDEVDVVKFYKISVLQPDELPKDAAFPDDKRDSAHTLYDAFLKKGGVLHRFNNPAGDPYSAIYIGMSEVFSCIREHEQQMIDYWNNEK